MSNNATSTNEWHFSSIAWYCGDNGFIVRTFDFIAHTFRCGETNVCFINCMYLQGFPIDSCTFTWVHKLSSKLVHSDRNWHMAGGVISVVLYLDIRRNDLGTRLVDFKILYYWQTAAWLVLKDWRPVKGVSTGLLLHSTGSSCPSVQVHAEEEVTWGEKVVLFNVSVKISEAQECTIREVKSGNWIS